MKIKNNEGPKMYPCGTPDLMLAGLVNSLPLSMT